MGEDNMKQTSESRGIKEVQFEEDYLIMGHNQDRSFSEEGDETDYYTRKHFVLVIYDISDNKRRRKMVKVIESYGFRVQKSAFEAVLRPSKYEKLIKEIEKIPDKTDSIRIYKIQGRGTVETFGQEFTIEDDDVLII